MRRALRHPLFRALFWAGENKLPHQFVLLFAWEIIQLRFITERNFSATFSVIAIRQQSPAARLFPLLLVLSGCKSWLWVHNNHVWRRFACNAIPSTIKKTFQLPPTQKLHVIWPSHFDAVHIVFQPFAVSDWRRLCCLQYNNPERFSGQSVFGSQSSFRRTCPLVAFYVNLCPRFGSYAFRFGIRLVYLFFTFHLADLRI